MSYLDITGLKAAYSELRRGASYAFLSPLNSQLLELVGHMLSNNKEPVFVLSEQIDLFFDSQGSDVLFNLFEQGLLYPFHLQHSNNVSKSASFSRGIIRELKHYKQLQNSSVFVHLDSAVIASLSDEQLIEKLTLYQALTKTKDVTLVFLISGAQLGEARQRLHAMNRFFDGLVHMTKEASIRSLEYDFWAHREGVIAGRTINLQLFNGQLALIDSDVNRTVESDVLLQQDLDEDEVWLTRNAVPQGTKLPASFKTIDDNDTLFSISLTKKAATIVFAVSRHTDLLALAKDCFSLRKKCGRKLKLVIQNVDGVIRHQDECLFLTLGVNLILYSFSEPSRLLSQIQSIQGFQFSRALPHSLDDVLKESENVLSKGYLPITKFSEQVLKHSDSAANLGVSGVFVKLQLLPRIDAIHPLHLFHVKREGDILSYADGYIYLYLHACREHDVENAIKHLFKLQISDFFSSKNIIADHFYIQQACRRIHQRYADSDVPDYTKELQNNVRNILAAKPAGIANLDKEKPEFRELSRPISEQVKVTLKSEVL